MRRDIGMLWPALLLALLVPYVVVCGLLAQSFGPGVRYDLRTSAARVQGSSGGIGGMAVYVPPPVPVPPAPVSTNSLYLNLQAANWVPTPLVDSQTGHWTDVSSNATVFNTFNATPSAGYLRFTPGPYGSLPQAAMAETIGAAVASITDWTCIVRFKPWHVASLSPCIFSMPIAVGLSGSLAWFLGCPDGPGFGGDTLVSPVPPALDLQQTFFGMQTMNNDPASFTDRVMVLRNDHTGSHTADVFYDGVKVNTATPTPWFTQGTIFVIGEFAVINPTVIGSNYESTWFDIKSFYFYTRAVPDAEIIGTTW